MPELFDNKYRFVKDLGSGGFGKVFLAKEERSENLVAIKQLKTKTKPSKMISFTRCKWYQRLIIPISFYTSITSLWKICCTSLWNIALWAVYGI